MKVPVECGNIVILNGQRSVLGNKEQSGKNLEATACIQSTLLSPVFYSSITYEQLIFYLSINFQGHLNLKSMYHTFEHHG